MGQMILIQVKKQELGKTGLCCSLGCVSSCGKIFKLNLYISPIHYLVRIHTTQFQVTWN